MHRWERRVRKLETPEDSKGECTTCRLRCGVVFNDPGDERLQPKFRCPVCGREPGPIKLIMGTAGEGV